MTYDPERGQAPRRKLYVTRNEAAYLLNLLSDNAREWNKGLRGQLAQTVTETDAYNAKLRLQGKQEP